METYNPIEMTVNTRFIAWICFYCAMSILCLSIILSGMAYLHLNEDKKIHYKRSRAVAAPVTAGSQGGDGQASAIAPASTAA